MVPKIMLVKKTRKRIVRQGVGENEKMMYDRMVTVIIENGAQTEGAHLGDQVRVIIIVINSCIISNKPFFCYLQMIDEWAADNRVIIAIMGHDVTIETIAIIEGMIVTIDIEITEMIGIESIILFHGHPLQRSMLFSGPTETVTIIAIVIAALLITTKTIRSPLAIADRHQHHKHETTRHEESLDLIDPCPNISHHKEVL